MTVEFHSLRTAAELAEVTRFEEFIWGAPDDLVPASMLVAVVGEGGLVLGGFVEEQLVATAFAFPTHERDVLHSHYIAVHPEFRRQGLGKRIKYEQVAWCRGNGYRSMRWTFDPLQLANANLNLNKLGARGVRYQPDLYGVMGGINGDLPSDRLTVQWWFDDPPAPFHEHCSVVVPDVSPAEIAASAPAAVAARLAVRDAFVPLLTDGWQVAAVDLGERRYTLGR